MSNPTVGEIPDHWEFTTLGEVCDRGGGNIQTGPFGSQLHASDYVEEGIPSIMPVNIGDNRLIEKDIKRITEEDAQRLSKHLVVPGDIIYSRRGDVERRALVREEQRGWFCGTGCIKVRLGEGVVDPAFASFYLDHPNVRQWIVQHAVGATMPNLNTGIMKAIPFALPPPEEQRAIASILGALDDKIELNRRMNATLESLARAIFKSWFVDFDPVKINAGQMPASSAIPTTHDPKVLDLFPSTFQDSELGPIPEGWSVEPLSAVAELRTDSVKPNQSPDTEWEHYSIPAFDDNSQPSIDLGETIKSNKYAVPENCVLVSKLNPRFPRVWMPSIQNSEVAICSTEFMPFVPHVETNRAFLFECICSEDFHTDMLSRTTGSTGSRQRVKPKEVAEISIVVPDADSLSLFAKRVTPIHNQMSQNRSEAIDLARLRDVLLPQLLSGELPVPAALTLAEEALA